MLNLSLQSLHKHFKPVWNALRKEEMAIRMFLALERIVDEEIILLRMTVAKDINFWVWR